jgi:hypothetical protein
MVILFNGDPAFRRRGDLRRLFVTVFDHTSGLHPRKGGGREISTEGKEGNEEE